MEKQNQPKTAHRPPRKRRPFWKRLNTKGKIFFGSLGVLGILSIYLTASAIVHAVATPTMSGYEWEYDTYTVKSGDTLWEIGQAYCPADVDVREWIDAVTELNSMGEYIQPGERLTVPAIVEEAEK